MRGVEASGPSTPPACPVGALGPCGAALSSHPAAFVECFAGEGCLSEAVSKLGVETLADEVSLGGTNFLDAHEVEMLQEKLLNLVGEGRRVALHVAPPCSTFSRARDRRRRTRLRSAEFPAGLPRCQEQVRDANAIALAAFDLVTWAAEQGILASLEKPA